MRLYPYKGKTDLQIGNYGTLRLKNTIRSLKGKVKGNLSLWANFAAKASVKDLGTKKMGNLDLDLGLLESRLRAWTKRSFGPDI